MKEQKRYPFNMQKHQHDLGFKSARLFNVAMDKAGRGEDPTAEWELKEKIDNISLMLINGNIVWLTWEELTLAREAVGWAVGMRG